MAKIIPAPAEIARETIIVLGGALLAAFIVGRIPALRQWVRENWDPPPASNL